MREGDAETRSVAETHHLFLLFCSDSCLLRHDYSKHTYMLLPLGPLFCVPPPQLSLVGPIINMFYMVLPRAVSFELCSYDEPPVCLTVIVCPCPT